jgi:hypothetical protein
MTVRVAVPGSPWIEIVAAPESSELAMTSVRMVSSSEAG